MCFSNPDECICSGKRLHWEYEKEIELQNARERETFDVSRTILNSYLEQAGIEHFKKEPNEIPKDRKKEILLSKLTDPVKYLLEVETCINKEQGGFFFYTLVEKIALDQEVKAECLYEEYNVYNSILRGI